ncbi:MAG TPA: hypothetical protein VHQ47_19645, partial [Phycisphaerae bacterium]|nr:hypothetical protein [Phycisphaerae bacterium]
TCPVSISRSIATICSSVNRFFIRLPAFPGWEVYMIQWRHFRGAGHAHTVIQQATSYFDGSTDTPVSTDTTGSSQAFNTLIETSHHQYLTYDTAGTIAGYGEELARRNERFSRQR